MTTTTTITTSNTIFVLRASGFKIIEHIRSTPTQFTKEHQNIMLQIKEKLKNICKSAGIITFSINAKDSQLWLNLVLAFL